jgi:hypothetical protein
MKINLQDIKAILKRFDEIANCCSTYPKSRLKVLAPNFYGYDSGMYSSFHKVAMGILFKEYFENPEAEVKDLSDKTKKSMDDFLRYCRHQNCSSCWINKIYKKEVLRRGVHCCCEGIFVFKDLLTDKLKEELEV